MSDKCPLCEKDALFSKLGEHFDQKTNQNYTLHECPKCHGQFWTPLKNPGSEWYEHDERYAHRNIDPHTKPNINHRRIISFLGPKTGKAKSESDRPSVLDVGCGTGNFLVWAKKNGWDPHGIDFDKDAVRAAHDVLGLKNVEVADLSEYHDEHPELKFNLVTFFDVFEHIDNHNEFTKMVSIILKPGGYIAMSMPYRGAARWLHPHDLPPRHLTKWDRESIRKFFNRQNFSIVYVKRDPASIYFIILKLRFRFGKYFSFNAVGKMKEKETERGVVNLNKQSGKRISYVHILAKIKDSIIFGVPALLIWIILLFTKKRYIGLYVIAKKNG